MSSTDHISPLPSDLQALLAELPADEQAGLMEAWMLAGDAPLADPSRRQADWDAVQRRMDENGPTVLRLVRKPLRLVVSHRIAAVAATVIVLVGVLAVFSLTGTRIRAPRGGLAVTEALLPDGSSVLLSPGSSVRFGRHFGDTERRVTLDGEAFFDVVHDGRTFVVETFNSEIEVLGTAFDVRAWPDSRSADTRVFLERGSVRVASTNVEGIDVRLQPGEATVVSGAGMPAPPAPASAERALAWRNGGIAFTDAPIGDVLDEVERRFNIEIHAPEDVRLSRISYYKYSVADADAILSDLTDATGLRYRRMARGFEVYIP